MHDRNSRLQGRHGLPARGPMNAGLPGTGLVADDLYLMAHHETSGKPFLQPRPLGIGLAGALLAELMLGGHAVVSLDRTVTASDTLPGRSGTRSQASRNSISCWSGCCSWAKAQPGAWAAGWNGPGT